METVEYHDLWYIAKWGDGDVVDNAIQLATKLPNWNAPPITHYSLWTPDWEGTFRFSLTGNRNSDGTKMELGVGYLGACWTSTTRGDNNGTVVRPASGVLKHPERWLYTKNVVNLESFRYARFEATARVSGNLGYAWRNLLRYGMPLWMFRGLGLEDKDRETCSQHGEHWKIDMGQLADDLIRSPRRLWHDTVKGTDKETCRLIDDVVVYRGLKVA